MSDHPDHRHGFDPLAPRAAQVEAARLLRQAKQEQVHANIRAAFASAPAAVKYLKDCLANADAQPSFLPGDDALTGAFNEGGRFALRKLVTEIDAALNPRAPTRQE